MDEKEKIGGAHIALLLLTAAFLASLAWMALRGEAQVVEADDYTIAVERSVPAAQLTPPDTDLVNINTATADELETLNGIGPVLAQRIVDYRAEHGAFTSEYELLRVEGVGEAKLDAIRGQITLGEEITP